MKTFLSFVFFSFLFLFPHNVWAIGGNYTVVNSSDPISKSAVAIVSVDDEGNEEQSCSGVYVAANKVLTAAHCMEFSSRFTFYVYFTLNYKSKENLGTPEENPNAKRVKGIFIPKEYQKDSFEKDYAILTFEGTAPSGYSPVSIFPKTDGFKVAELKVTGGEVNVRNPIVLTIAGFSNTGTPNDDGTIKPDSGLLRKTETFYLTESPSYRGSFLVGPKRDAHISVGDSGGPVYVREDGRLYLLGVVSGFIKSELGDTQLITDVRFLKGTDLLK